MSLSLYKEEQNDYIAYSYRVGPCPEPAYQQVEMVVLSTQVK